MSKPTDREIITAARDLLGQGLLASLLPARLMAEYHLTRERAARLAQEALRQRQEAIDNDPALLDLKHRKDQAREFLRREGPPDET